MLAIALLGIACAALEQRPGWNELSHLAQIRAFAHGTPIIDHYVGPRGDRAFYHGHYYGDKAPGLALFMVPIYWLASLIGIVGGSGRAATIMALHLMVIFACVIPFCVLLLLVRSWVDRHDPGRGGAVALILGAGTLLLPFATLLFSHVLSTCLGFASFWMLERQIERQMSADQAAAVTAGSPRPGFWPGSRCRPSTRSPCWRCCWSCISGGDTRG